MGFLDRLLGREKKTDDMPAEPPMRSEGTMPETEGMADPMAEPISERPEGMTREPGGEGSHRDTP